MSTQAPIPMLLWCPECSERHVDVDEFEHRPHHTHACQHCGMVWRPALVATVGVDFLPGFKNEPTDTLPPSGRIPPMVGHVNMPMINDLLPGPFQGNLGHRFINLQCVKCMQSIQAIRERATCDGIEPEPSAPRFGT